jgi:hypothetical protein
MAADAIKIPMRQVMPKVTLHMVITGMVRARLRLWLGARIIRLGGYVIGCSVEMVVKPDGERPCATDGWTDRARTGGAG